MALVLADRVKETTTTTGTGTITLAGAAVGFQSFAVIGNGNTTYYTIAGQGTAEWEVGIGTYTASGTTLSRDTVLASSNSGSLVSFSSGAKDVFVTYPAKRTVYSGNTDTLQLPAPSTSGNILTSDGSNWNSSPAPSAFPSGTAMLFAQTAAPTGWTKSTTHNNKALRVVSGTAGSGGTVDFTTVFASQSVNGTVGDTTLTTAQMPTHSHTATVSDPTHNHSLISGNTGGINQQLQTYTGVVQNSGYTSTRQQVIALYAAYTGISVSNSNNGSSGSHNHSFTGTSIDLSVKYVDVIIATKD